MNSKLKVRVAIAVFVSAFLLGGSVNARKADAKPKPEPPLSTRIVGQWISEPFEASVGKVTQMFCFKADGTVEVRTDLPAGPMSNSGTYFVETDRLTVKLKNPVGSVELRVSWQGERLVLTDESEQARTYDRGKGC